MPATKKQLVDYGNVFQDSQPNSVIYLDGKKAYFKQLTVVKCYAFAVTGDLTAANDVAPTLEGIEDDQTITEVRILVKTAPTGATIIVDVNKNGTTIFTTQSNRPVIAISGTEGQATTIEVSSLAKGDNLTVDVDQIGSGTAGADLTIQVLVEKVL